MLIKMWVIIANSAEAMCDRRRAGRRRRMRQASFAVVVLSFMSGCSRVERYPVSGNVTVNGAKADSGRVFLVPVEGVKGPRVAAQISDGVYTFNSDGGLAPGKYRVELEALRKTGRKTKARLVGGEMAEVDETEQLAPAAYRGEESPLLVDVPYCYAQYL